MVTSASLSLGSCKLYFYFYYVVGLDRNKYIFYSTLFYPLPFPGHIYTAVTWSGCIVSTWNKFPSSHVNSFITQGALISNMHPSRKQRLFFIFLVMKMVKHRKIRYHSRFHPSCHFRDG